MTETEPGKVDPSNRPAETDAAEAPAPPAGIDAAPVPEAPIESSVFLPRNPKALTLSLIIGGVVTAVVAGFLSLGVLIVAVIAGFDSPPAAAALTLAVVVILILSFFLLVMPRWRHQRYRYCADEGGLRIHRGVWWRSRIHVPRSRLQHTDIAQGPLERRLGLASLVVHTAGTHASATYLTGISFEAAVAVRELLTGEEEELTDGV